MDMTTSKHSDTQPNTKIISNLTTRDETRQNANTFISGGGVRGPCTVWALDGDGQ